MAKALSILITISVVFLKGNARTCSTNKSFRMQNGQNRRCVSTFDGWAWLHGSRIYNPNLAGQCTQYETIPAHDMTSCNYFCHLQYQTQGCNLNGGMCYCLDQLNHLESIKKVLCTGWQNVFNTHNDPEIRMALAAALDVEWYGCRNYGWRWES